MMTASNIRSLRAKSRSARAAFAALALLSTPALAQSLAISGATLAIGDGSEPIRNGTVLISAGKVTAAGAGIAIPPGIKAIDAGGKWVTPGLVSGYSRVGLVEVPAVNETNDASARSTFSTAIAASGNRAARASRSVRISNPISI